MASIFMLKSLVLSQLLLLISAHYHKCPSSIECRSLGTSIRFPLTVTELPQCGVLAIDGCNDQNPAAPKSIQISYNRSAPRFDLVKIVDSRSILIKDDTFRSNLRSQNCNTFSYDLGLPLTSPLGSLQIKYNITLFRCNKSLSVTPSSDFYKNTSCPDFNLYYGPPNIGNTTGFNWPRALTECSKIQLALKGEPNTGNPFSFLSGELLLGIQLSDDCNECAHVHRGQCQLDSQGKFYCARDNKSALKLGLGIGLPCFIIAVFFMIIWLWRRRCGPNFNSNPEPKSGTGSVFFGVPVFTYKDLEAASKSFDPSRVLGDGGFGTVYYGKLKDGREVAIKRLFDHNCRRVEQFMNEVQILTRLRHINLVSLYGCTSRHSHELLLVYEYISNGTVASHLRHGSTRGGLLPWPIRMKVAIETATALAYLHASDIIHRDVKTNNILLDNNFTVKVADFGMSRLFPNDVTHVSTAPQGTPGYLDPEYHQFYQLTSKSDVYSFGVVLIELISSMPVVDMNRQRDEISLANLAINKIKNGEISELVDPSLGLESDSDVRREIVSVAELAFQCLQRDKELRPSMNEVLLALGRIESGKDEAGSVEEVFCDVSSASPSPPSPDHDEVKLLKNMKPSPSPKSVTDKWDSESVTPNISSQSSRQSNVSIRSFSQEKTNKI